MDSVLIDALDRRDVDSARTFIEAEDDAARVLAMYHGAIRHLYWSRKDITTLAAIGAAALAFGDGLTDRNQLGLLKSVAYDLGSFCWPGWDEPGIEIGASMRTFGASAADLNLELAERLGRSEGPMAAAHWLVGAHLLAAGDRPAAITSFETSASLARTAGDHVAELLAEGYTRISRHERPDIVELQSLEHGNEVAAQLQTAFNVFGAS